jgi:hypothetical protein
MAMPGKPSPVVRWTRRKSMRDGARCDCARDPCAAGGNGQRIERSDGRHLTDGDHATGRSPNAELRARVLASRRDAVGRGQLASATVGDRIASGTPGHAVIERLFAPRAGYEPEPGLDALARCDAGPRRRPRRLPARLGPAGRPGQPRAARRQREGRLVRSRPELSARNPASGRSLAPTIRNL